MTTVNRLHLVAAVLIIAATLIGGTARADTLPCPAGVYGIAGDWGPGSLRADTYHNRVWVRRHYSARVAYRANRNIPPPRCTVR